LTDIRATLAEVTVIQSEEKDGRLNERWPFQPFKYLVII
jgi:hypothetical protein